MIRRIETESYTLYLAPLPANHDDSMTRNEREQKAGQMLIDKAFGCKAVKSHYDDGAPYISGAEETVISISHSTSTCLLAVGKTNAWLGADIEKPRPQLDRVKSKFLSTEEAGRHKALNDETDRMHFLLKCWTAKEAVYKAARTPGLGLTEIEVSEDFSHAVARERTYSLTYHYVDGEEIVCVSRQLIS